MKLNILKGLGQRQAAAQAFIHWVLSYRDGRNSWQHLSEEFKANMLRDTAPLFAELAGGTGEELTPEILKAKINLSVTLLLGGQSVPPLSRSATALASLISVSLVKLPSANHLAQVEQPEEFVKVINTAMT